MILSQELTLNQNALLVGQIDESIKVYFALQLTDSVSGLLADLGAKSQLNKFLSEVQDVIFVYIEISSLVGLGLKVVGICITSQVEYAKNMNIWKKMAELFEVSQFIVKLENSYSIFNAGQLSITQVQKIDKKLFKLINVKSVHALLNDDLESLKQSLEQAPLLLDGIEQKTANSNCQAQFLAQIKSNNKARPLHGHVVQVIIVEAGTSTTKIKKLLIEDLITSLQLRLKHTQLEDLNKCYLPQRIFLKTESALILQDYFEDSLEHEYEQRISNLLKIKVTVQLEEIQKEIIIKGAKSSVTAQEEEIYQQKYEANQAKQVTSAKSNPLQEYYLMGGLLVLLVAIYVGYL